jgi:hypothetical protein
MYNDNENHGMLNTTMVLKPTFTQFKNIKAEVIKTSDTEVTIGNVNKLPLAMRQYLIKDRAPKVNASLRRRRQAAQNGSRIKRRLERKFTREYAKAQALVAPINVR